MILDSSLFWSSERSFSADKYAFRKYWSIKRYIGVVRQMITVLHGGGVSNDYGTPWILGCYIRNIISRDLTKKIRFLSVGKKSFLEGMSKLLQLYIGGGYGEMITVLHRGGYAQMITILHRGEGSLRTPKSDYVICARPLMKQKTPCWALLLCRPLLFVVLGKFR